MILSIETFDVAFSNKKETVRYVGETEHIARIFQEKTPVKDLSELCCGEHPH